MTLGEVWRSVREDNAFYRAAQPDVLYERIGTLIERDGLPTHSVRFQQHVVGTAELVKHCRLHDKDHDRLPAVLVGN